MLQMLTLCHSYGPNSGRPIKVYPRWGVSQVVLGDPLQYSKPVRPVIHCEAMNVVCRGLRHHSSAQRGLQNHILWYVGDCVVLGTKLELAACKACTITLYYISWPEAET